MQRSSKKGAITVFLAIVLMAVFLLAAIFIDAARIAVAERRVQSALNTAARSSLAGYDADLAAQFGLFGVDHDTLKDNTLHYLNVNLKERHEGIRLIRYGQVGAEDVKVQGQTGFLNKDAFKRQIAEYMKYKAPATMTESLIQKLRKLNFSKKVEFSGKETEVRKNVKNIKGKTQKSDDARERLIELKQEAKSILQTNREKAIQDMRKALEECLGVQSTLPEILQDLNGYSASHAAAEACAKELQGAGESILASGVDYDGLQSKIDQAKTALGSNVIELNRVIPLASGLDQELKALESRLQGLESAKEPDQSAISGVEQEIAQKNQELQGIFSSLSLSDLPKLSIDEDIASKLALPQDQENAKGKIEEFMRRMKDQLLLNQLDPNWLIHQEEFDASQADDAKKQQQMSSTLESMRLQGTNRETAEAKAEDGNKDILAWLNQVKELVDLGLAHTRDNIYITEYIMDKYTFMTSKTERGHFFEKGEVEYILWGRDVQAENIVLTGGQILFARFAIDTLDYFVTSPDPEPYTRLIAAVTAGAVRSFVDMFHLYRGEGCSICPSAEASGVLLAYSDHLRLLLLLENEDQKISRMQQLIQVDVMQAKKSGETETEKDFALKDCSVEIQVEAEVKINLWFLPVFQLDKLGLPNFEQGRYVIRKRAVISY